jgi:hypothetical protein
VNTRNKKTPNVQNTTVVHPFNLGLGPPTPPRTNLAMTGLASALSQEKLRSTCNQCALSKVRCNKRKPTCQRCETHDFECVYDRSRRRGKPRSSQEQRCLDGRSTPSSAQSGLYNWPNSYDNMDPFPEFSNLLPGDDIVDFSLCDGLDNMLYGGNSDSTREGSSSGGEMIGDKGSSMAQDQQQSQKGDSSVLMTFAPLDKPCQGEICTSTAFCTLGTL